jgi:CheY-like chemotaxis protein
MVSFASPAAKRSLHILMADDDAVICSVIEALIRHRGHTVDVACNGEEAIKLFALQPARYDLLITDHEMPLVTGLELVRHLRKHGFSGGVIVVSEILRPQISLAYKYRPIDTILRKPFNAALLAHTLGQMGGWLDESLAAKENPSSVCKAELQ